MERLNRLIKACKAGVHLTVNRHRDYYETVKQYLDGRENMAGESLEIKPNIRRFMEDKDTVVELQFYPLTPIGFHLVWHHDISSAIDEALRVMNLPLIP